MIKDTFKSLRLDSLDVMKFLCSVLVLAIHTRPFYPYSTIADLYISQGLCRFAVPLFFAASGFLLFSKVEKEKGLMSADNRKLLATYVWRLVKLYVTWAAVYYIYFIQSWAFSGKLTKTFIVEQIRLFFFEAAHYHFWYILATIYALFPVYLLSFLRRKIQFLIILILWPISSLQYTYSWTGLCADQFLWVQANCDALSNTLLRAIPLILVGVLSIDGHKEHSHSHWARRSLLWIVAYFTELTLAYYLSSERIHFEYLLSCPFLIYNLFCWIVTSQLRFNHKTLPSILRFCSEWIYCSHPLIILILELFFLLTGFTRFAVVLGVCFFTGIGYAFAKVRRS